MVRLISAQLLNKKTLIVAIVSHNSFLILETRVIYLKPRILYKKKKNYSRKSSDLTCLF